MGLRTKGITLIGFLSSILMGMSGGGFASAAAPVTISDNPNSPQSIEVKHVIQNAYPMTDARLVYYVGWCDSNTLGSENTSFRFYERPLEFSDTLRNEDGEAVATSIISFADVSFNLPGTYEFCFNETKNDPSNGIPTIDITRYKLFVDVVNKLDGNGEPTGELEATLVPQALNLTTGEKGEIIFTTEAEKTSMQFTHNVSGAKADRDHYFPYDVQLTPSSFMPNGETYVLEGLDSSFTDNYTNIDRTNPTTITAGPHKVRVYLKDGQTLRIGKKNGVDDLPPGELIIIEAVSINDLESNYSVEINGEAQSLFEAYLEPMLGDNPTDVQRLAFQQNNDVKIVRNLSYSTVSTGLVMRIMPFVAVVFVAGIVGVVAYRSDRKKNIRRL